MNSNELKLYITAAILIAIVLVTLICSVMYYNVTELRTQISASGKPTNTILYIHKLDDEQFAQLLNALRPDATEIIKTEEKSK